MKFSKDNSLPIGRFVTRLYPDIGGPAKHAFQVSHTLNHSGFVNHVVSGHPEGSMHTGKEGLSVYRLPIKSPPRGNIVLRLLFTVSYLFLSLTLGLFFLAGKRIRILHAHSPWLSGLTGLIIGRLLGIPIVYTIHGLSKWSVENPTQTHADTKLSLDEWIASKMDAVVSVSPVYTEYFAKRCPDLSVTTIGNGVDTAEFYPAENQNEKSSIRKSVDFPIDKIIVLYVGNFSLPEKVSGLLDLLTSFSNIEEALRANSKLVIAGDGPSREMLETTCESLGISHDTIFLGYRKDVNLLMRASDVFVLSSRNEGSPNALLEAMASGLACVATEVGGMPSIIDGAGFLVQSGSTQNLTRILEQLLKSEDLRNDTSQKARTHAEKNLSWEKTKDETVAIYEDLLRETR